MKIEAKKDLDSIPYCGFRGEYTIKELLSMSKVAFINGICNQFGQPILDVMIKGIPYKTLMDTGAPYNFLNGNEEKAKSLGLSPTGDFVEVDHVVSGPIKMPVYRVKFLLNGVELETDMGLDHLHATEVILGMPFFKAFDEFRLYPKLNKWQLIKNLQ